MCVCVCVCAVRMVEILPRMRRVQCSIPRTLKNLGPKAIARRSVARPPLLLVSAISHQRAASVVCRGVSFCPPTRPPPARPPACSPQSRRVSEMDATRVSEQAQRDQEKAQAIEAEEQERQERMQVRFTPGEGYFVGVPCSHTARTERRMCMCICHHAVCMCACVCVCVCLCVCVCAYVRVSAVCFLLSAVPDVVCR